MLHLSKPGYLRELSARSRLEFGVAAIVIAGELALPDIGADRPGLVHNVRVFYVRRIFYFTSVSPI
jgi:hypothetical protein